MFEHVRAPTPDGLMTLQALVNADRREDLLDLGVGVYRDDTGRTPVLAAVKAAEAVLLERQTTKSYLTPSGDGAFLSHMTGLVLGENLDRSRLAAVQAPGGTGALRQALELVKIARPDAKVFVGAPTWPNHIPLIEAARLRSSVFPYADMDRRQVRLEQIEAALAAARPGDVFLIHGCCHNPTGIDLSRAECRHLGELFAGAGVTPLVDVAYLGFGAGLDEDLADLRELVRCAPEAMIAVSCSKMFSLYRERTGMLLTITERADDAGRVQALLGQLARTNYSSPPDHGASVVRTIFEDAELTASWRAELKAMAARITGVRTALAAADPALGLQSVARERGMFSLLRLSPQSIQDLRERHAIYLPDTGRISMAGLNPRVLPRFVAALRAVRGPELAAADAPSIADS